MRARVRVGPGPAFEAWTRLELATHAEPAPTQISFARPALAWGGRRGVRTRFCRMPPGDLTRHRWPSARRRSWRWPSRYRRSFAPRWLPRQSPVPASATRGVPTFPTCPSHRATPGPIRIAPSTGAIPAGASAFPGAISSSTASSGNRTSARPAKAAEWPAWRRTTPAGASGRMSTRRSGRWRPRNWPSASRRRR